MFEELEVVSDQNIPTGIVLPRQDVHAGGMWHRVANIFLYRTTAAEIELLCHEKPVSEDSQLDPAFGGHILAGEDPLRGAMRETYEEVGLQLLPESARYGGCFKIQDSPTERKFNYYFFYKIASLDIASLKIQRDEIARIFWCPSDIIGREMQLGGNKWVGNLPRYKKILKLFNQASTSEIPQDGSFEED